MKRHILELNTAPCSAPHMSFSDRAANLYRTLIRTPRILRVFDTTVVWLFFMNSVKPSEQNRYEHPHPSLRGYEYAKVTSRRVIQPFSDQANETNCAEYAVILGAATKDQSRIREQSLHAGYCASIHPQGQTNWRCCCCRTEGTR